MRRRLQNGFTLIELVIVLAIIGILLSIAIPVYQKSIEHARESALKQDLATIRSAIDRYKAAADRGAFRTKAGSENYPPDLQTLVDGVDINGKKLRFLRKVPTDPMTGNTEWGQRSVQDDPKSETWGGQDVFDVFTKSNGTGLNGTQYKDW